MYVRILDDLDVRSLQLALDAIVQWSDAWQLPTSIINKCCVQNIGKVTYRPNTDVHINGCTLPVVTHTRDLGVIVSSDLSPSVHITDIVSKAHQRAGLILRTFISRDIHLLCVLSWFMCVLLSNITQSLVTLDTMLVCRRKNHTCYVYCGRTDCFTERVHFGLTASQLQL